jgi:alpha-beta hydrolase superfamily lysophospholipase
MTCTQKISYLSADGEQNISASIWEPDGQPVAVLQLVHGMAEHIGRYDGLATFLTEQGFVVAGNDHLGHGDSVSADSELGYMTAGKPDEAIVTDIHTLNRYLHKQYPNVPLFILGHSMGSFAVRVFLQRYSDQVDGAILMGTSGPRPEIKVVLPLLALLNRQAGRKKNALLDQLIFAGYAKAFPDDAYQSRFCWLSKNAESVRRFEEDEKCGFLFTNNAFYGLLALQDKGCSLNWSRPIRRSLPMLFVNGEADPLAQGGAGTKRIKQELLKNGFEHVIFLSYPELRHEILHEKEKDLVHLDILHWLKKQL